jgi:hypothetical protein
VAMNGVPGSWEPFLQGICAQEKLPQFDRLWIDCIQEEARIESKNGKQKSIDDENLALNTHARKGRRNGSPRREASPKQRKKKDLSKVNCFACHMLGHCASQCPKRKEEKAKQQASLVEVDEVAVRLQREFLLVFVLSNTISVSGTWLVDSGATCHMTRARDFFESFTDQHSPMHAKPNAMPPMPVHDKQEQLCHQNQL